MTLKLCLPLISALALVTACDQLGLAPSEPASETATDTVSSADAARPATPLQSVGPNADTVRAAQIDWESALRDKASQEDSDNELVGIASSGEPAAVPILLPTGIVTPASAERGIMVRKTPDGYFASYPGEVYDIVINGTNLIAGTADDVAERAGEPVFTASVAGAQLSLSRYGADYLIEFECNIDLPAESDTCITEDEAFDMAEKLIVVGTQ